MNTGVTIHEKVLVIEHSEKAVNSMKIKRIFTETRSESICVGVKYSSKQFGL